MTHRSDPPPRATTAPRLVVVLILGLVLLGAPRLLGGGGGETPPSLATATFPVTTPTVPPAPTATWPTVTTVEKPEEEPPPTTQPPVRQRDEVPAWTIGEPWGTTRGLTMFRGNPTRTLTGGGPVPSEPPEVVWRYPENPMCSQASNLGGSTVWCGFGWTGQPIVWERPDGVTEIIFGAYDGAIHFVDADSGEALRPRFQTGGHVKGSETLDPDGYPLLYSGSRDGKMRILSLEGPEATELWSMHARDVDGIWNSDWDSNPVIVDDIMYQGGENGWFYVVELNRGYGDDGGVTVDPEFLVRMPGYDQEWIQRTGRNLSIETSAVLFDRRVYFANSGGRVVGLDLTDVRGGEAPIVFDYWAGGDIDATMVVDHDGMLYVSVNVKPDQVGPGYRTGANIERTREVGQLIKLDPYTTADPRVWGVDLTAGSQQAGSWSTPAVYAGIVYVNTHQGELLAVDAETGERVWSDEVGWHSWSSPVVTDDTLVTVTCLGDVRAYDLADPRSPEPLWSVSLGEACLEATPAVWDGAIYIGSRDGYIRALR